MQKWNRQIQSLIEEIDQCILLGQDETLSLAQLSSKLNYSPFYISHKFREISGMQLRDYLRYRKLAFALKELRDGDLSILQIAVKYGFSSHEAFTRAFKEAYSITPSEYRQRPCPVVLRTIIKPFDCYLLEIGGKEMSSFSDSIKTYFITIPAHKFLHIKNYTSIGYWDFWQKQSQIPGQDCATICGLLDSIPNKLDDCGGTQADSSSGQIMAFINDPQGRICSWGIPLAECYGVRLPADYNGEYPSQMLLADILEGEYIVFEHGPFDFESQNQRVEAEMEAAMNKFDYAAHGYCLDTTPGRIFYFYHDCTRFWKYIRPVRKL